MDYDPTIYLGSSPYFACGRPPYSRDLVATLIKEACLDGTGRLLDVGCGPGTLAIELAANFEETIGLDPDADMLAVGVLLSTGAGVAVRFVRAVAEDIPMLALGSFRVVTIGQSFHWTDGERVAESVYEILEPGGTLALVSHVKDGRPEPQGPGHPPMPHDAIRELIDEYLGPRRRAGQGFASPQGDRYEDALARTRFGRPRTLFCAGRPDIVQDVEGVLANCLSNSFAAPHLFGDRLEQFKADVRARLLAHSPNGLFWDWPGDTEILLAGKAR